MLQSRDERELHFWPAMGTSGNSQFIDAERSLAGNRKKIAGRRVLATTANKGRAVAA
jgi:hypothetical protein